MAITFTAGSFINQVTHTIFEITTGAVGVWWRRNGRPAGTQMEIMGKHSSLSSAEGFAFYLENTAGANQDTLNLYAKNSSQTLAFSIKHLSQVAFDGGWHLASANLRITNGATNDLYLDGIGKVSGTNSVGWDLGGVPQPLRLGKSNDTFWQSFDGSLAHAFYYNETLTDAEHLALASGVSPLLIRPHALLFYLPMTGPDFIKNSMDVIPLSAALTTSGTLTQAALNPPIDYGVLDPNAFAF